MEQRGFDTCDPEQGHEACRDAYINATSGPIKRWKFLDCLKMRYILKKDSAVWNYAEFSVFSVRQKFKDETLRASGKALRLLVSRV